MSIGGYNPATNNFVSGGKFGGVLAALAARTAAYTGDTMYNPGAVGLRVDVHISSINAVTPSVTFKIQKLNQASGVWADVIASAAKVAVGTFSLTVAPSVAAAANEVAEEEAPGVWRVVTAVGDADAMTYAIAYEYLLSQLAPSA